MAEQWLDTYGGAPEDMGFVDINVEDTEMCFVQYLPIAMPNSDYQIPESLQWVGPLLSSMRVEDLESDYIYLTVKKVFGTGNRNGWHCDGFGTDDINYTWCDSHPTEFLTGLTTTDMPNSHKDSLHLMETYAILTGAGGITRYPDKHLIRMDQRQIHRVNPRPCNHMRTFVKISCSNEKYNMQGNAHNYLFDYDWDMVNRSIGRNHTVGG